MNSSAPSRLADVRSAGWFDQLGRDFRHSLRMLVRQPGFTATALATLALCIGANVAIFAVVDAILLRPLPFPESERLVTVFNSYPKAGAEFSGASVANYYDRREAIKAFSSVSGFQDGSVIVGAAGSPQRVPIARVTPEFFATLGVPFAKGKTFTDAELAYGPDEVAVLTDEFWRSHFHADPQVLGQKFFNDGLTVTVIGVLPPDFRFLSSRARFFRPASHERNAREARQRHSNSWQMIARLAPGATLAQAQAQMDAFNAQQLTDDPLADLVKGAGYHSTVRSLHGHHVRTVKPMLLLLQGGVLCLLLIGAVNLANLLLIRASGRAKELAVRQALGATGWHIAREVSVETLLLAGAGGMLGLALGALGIRLLATLGTDQLPLAGSIAFDGRIAAVSLAGAVVVGGLLALPVIWLNLRTRLAGTLQSESRSGTAGRAAQRVRHGFIVAQVALAFVLLSGAGLLGLSLKRVLETPPGFTPEQVFTGRLALPWKSYKDNAARLAFIERLLPALRSIPGVTHAAISSGVPFSGVTNDSAVFVEGHVPRPGDSVRAHYLSMASGEYWRAMNIPLRRGRFLEDSDNQGKQRVCVVDQAFADRYWPGLDPIGRRLAPNDSFKEENANTVVGVVASVKQTELAEAGGHGAVYFPYVNYATNNFVVVLRTSLPPASFAPAVRKTILELDPSLPADDLRPLQARIDESLVARRSPAVLAGIFAGVALLLAAIGTYGVLAYSVSQRRREIGVRMALGALPRQVLVQFLQMGAKLLALGVALGALGAWAVERGIQSVLVDVSSARVEIFAVTAVLMGVVVLLASLLPSRRAAQVSPMEALRAE
ncbi:MAG TPA: ABC transporter permease [Opitutaceae bacterium]|nr:ABC transporter permease [Opitutaceae bacterium]